MAIAYEQLGDDTISAIPVAKIQTDGYLFMWVINAKYRLAMISMDDSETSAAALKTLLPELRKLRYTISLPVETEL